MRMFDLAGFGKNVCKVYVITHSRTLEFEAHSTAFAKEWIEACEFLIQFQVAFKQQRELLVASDPQHESKVSLTKQECSKLLIEGDMFKKWPGRKKLQSQTFTVRRVWASSNLDRLFWGEPNTTKVKGYIPMADIVNIEEDDQDDLKFTVFCTGRSLDLEARAAWVRNAFVRAFRFFIEYNKVHPLPRVDVMAAP